MVTLKSKREIDQMKESGAILAAIHKQLREIIKPGITTKEIDQFVQEKSRRPERQLPKLVLKAMNLLHVPV